MMVSRCIHSYLVLQQVTFFDMCSVPNPTHLNQPNEHSRNHSGTLWQRRQLGNLLQTSRRDAIHSKGKRQGCRVD